MSILSAIIGVVLLLCALIQCIVGIAGWAQKLPGNPYVGIRVPEVRKTPEMWNTAHRIAGPLWTVGGICLAAAGALCFMDSGWKWLLVVLTIIGWLVFLGMGAGMAANAVAYLDASAKDDGGCGDGGCGCGDGGCGGGAEPAPEVNVDAVKNAAAQADANNP
ncbi:MAG: SdpI family protein [Corynebacterium sp.]|nr:SdpI family protein [Corynebacterium sp.]